MEHPFPRDGGLEKDVEVATSMHNVEVREDGQGNVWLIVKRAELDAFLERCGKVDDFLKDFDKLHDHAPDWLGK